MKKYFILLIIYICCNQFVAAQNTQTRSKILEKLVIFYIPNPGNPMPTTQAGLDALVVNCRPIFDGNDLGTHPIWTEAHNAGIKNLLIKLFRTPGAAGGDANFQRIIRNVLSITNKKVKVYLYNDFSLSSSPDPSWSIYCEGGALYSLSTPNTGNRSWPCANIITGSADFSGHIAMGNYFFQSYSANANWKLATLIHELVHTQLSFNNAAGLSGGVRNYGSDNLHHTYDEILPAYNAALNEGLANGFAFRYYLGDNGMASWFNGDSIVYVDDITCTTANAFCHQAHLAALTPPVSGFSCTVGNHTAKCYRIRSIPAHILMYNENTYANIFYQFMQQFRGGEFMVADIIHDSLSVIANASRRPFSVIFKGLVTKGMNYHNPQLPEGQRTNGQHLPLAILDFYTGYKLTDKPTLERCLGESWNPTDTNIDRFFSTHRNTFHSFRSSPTSWQVRYISSLAEHLNVKTSSAASPTSPANPSPSGN